MMRRLAWFVILTAAGAFAQSAPETLVIRGGTLIDGTGGAPVRDALVVIRGDRIVAAGPRAQVQAPKGARVINAKGKWIIPGLIDSHVHFFQSGGLYTRPDVIDLRAKVPYERERGHIAKRLRETFARYLCAGVTSAVDVGGPMWNFEVRNLARREAMAPRVAVAGPLVSTYEPEALKTGDRPIILTQTPEEARALVRRELAQKPDLVKVWYIRRPGDKVEDTLPVVQAAIEEAHHGGVRMAVHGTQLDTAKAAVRAGADILVHSIENEPVDDEFIALLKERGTILIPAITVYEGYGEVLSGNPQLTDADRACGDPEVIASWAELPPDKKRDPARAQRVVPTAKQNLKRLHDAGVKIAAGTDAGNIGTLHGSAMHREFELMSEAGLTPMQILVSATTTAAQVFSSKPEQGTLTTGKLADLVVLDADPLADIRNARKVRYVMKGGHLYPVREVRKRLAR
jgi:imidazolonepropionase-like amidohydrolase